MKYIVVKRVDFEYHVEADSEEDALEKFKLKQSKMEKPDHWDINIDVVADVDHIVLDEGEQA